MSKQDSSLGFLKIQSCVLKVNVHCAGCEKKVKKLLQKIDGVYTVGVDAEHGRVTVSGSVDPSTLIKKLAKTGKHAELLGPKGGAGGAAGGGKNTSSIGKNNKANGNGGSFLSDQLQKLKLDGWKGQPQPQKDGGKAQKGGKEQKGEHHLLKDVKPAQAQLQGLNFPPQKDQKNVKFSLPGDFDDGSDFDDLDDDMDSIYDDLDDLDDDLDSIYDDLDMKPVANKKGGGGGGGGANDKKGGGSKDSKKGEKNGSDGGKSSKKGGDKSQGVAVGNHQKMMGQGIVGVPAGAAAAAANPYQQMQQQQYMQQMMRQQQQQQQQQQQMMMMNGPTVYGPTVYGQPMGYAPAVPAPAVYGDPYGNYFSDENTNSGCSIM